MFNPVGSRVSFPEMEEAVLAFWKEADIFAESVRQREGSPRFTLFEGPPTANGSPGIHHVLARVFKDVITRYRVMKGYHAPRNAGWDTHGLPVELEVEKELGFSSKADIESYGIDKFNQKCRESVFRYLQEWNSLTERIGFWVDLEHPYITMENSYIETVWWALKQMWEKGLIYQGHKVTPHCPRCGTSLSSHEVALGYQEDTEDPSVYIKFKVDAALLSGTPALERIYKLTDNNTKSIFLLAWTTTPWTLPGNTALAVSPSAEYSVVEVEGEYIIIATARIAVAGLEGFPIVDTVMANDLVLFKYEPLFNPDKYGVEREYAKGLLPYEEGVELSSEKKSDAPAFNLTYPVVAGTFVTMDDGTGIVHIAPAFGEEDYRVMQDEPEVEFVQHVDLQGNITGNYPFSGKFVKEADPLVLAELEKTGLLHEAGTIKHTYPFCWRCATPILYYAKASWYIRTTALKERLIAGNEEINWYPEHIKYGRFGDWLANNVDWAFSRERYWGTPLPVWRCESCEQVECAGSVAELREKTGYSGLSEPLDLHRPYVDEATYDCPRCGEKMRRVPDVIDCWFDSGAMPIAQSHYPFENETLLEDGRYPADYICEAVDQTRGWFYSLHAISTLLFDKPSYRNVICLGHILDSEGEKMSKTRGNVVEPGAVISQYGADALRWYFYTSSPPGNVRRFSSDIISELQRRLFNTLWNVYSFFVTYANIDKYVPGEEAPPVSAEIDRWLMSELHQLISDVDGALDVYNPTEAGRRIEAFVDYLSNWYVRRSRRRFWKSESDADKLSAYYSLYTCLETLTRLMAPLAPFISEEIYRNLVLSARPKEKNSVHLADYPVADTSQIDAELNEATRLAMKVSSLGRAVRSKAQLKVRQPLPVLYVRAASGQQKRGLERLADQILEEVNVKELKVVDELPAGDMPATEEGDITVMLDTAVTPELAAEGMAREIVHKLQNMRRTAGFNIEDHILAYYQGDDNTAEVMQGFEGYIRQETLSDELLAQAPPDNAHAEKLKLGGREILLGVTRLA
ncbi:isoleucine--tRNA ligase [Chloroflexota bacterium]